MLVALQRTSSRMSTLCTGESQAGCNSPDVISRMLCGGEQALDMLVTLLQISPVWNWPRLLQGHIGNSTSTCSPGHPGLSLQSCFLTTCFSACTVAYSCSILTAGLLICLYQTSWSSCQPIFPGFLGHSKKQPAF